MIKPYYEEPGITIYHGDCRDILPSLPKVDLVLTDPPYGISLKTDFLKSRLNSIKNRTAGSHTWTCNSYPEIFEDNKPFDPSFLLVYKKIALFGANNYASKLEDFYSWLVWDKKTEKGADNDLGDAELIWCKGSNRNSVKIFRHMWHGYQRDSEVGEKHIHPTQKPIQLMQWVMGFFEPFDSVLDPFMGSGTTLRAAKDLGRKAIGIEIEEKYCEIAVKRLAQEVLPL